MVVEPGVTNLAISQAVAPTHFYPPDPSSQIVCSIGGNIAENSGGAHCFKYGFTTNYVTGLEVVLTDGSIVELDRDAPGYDLLGAFVGSEGTLGVATRITLRVVPATGVGAHAGGVLRGHRRGRRGGQRDRRGRDRPRRDRDDGPALDPGRRGRRPAPATGSTPARRCSSSSTGPSEECQTRFARGDRAARAEPARSRSASPGSEQERELIWKARKAAFAAMGRIAPAYYVQDGVIPRTRLPEVLERIEQLSAEYGLQVANVFHAGDGNLHPLVCYDAAREGEPERAEELAGLIVKTCVDAGGSITGEHGVGVDKKAYMPSMFSEPDLEAFQRLRCAFDPYGLANPGKVMPTPRLCGEVPGPYREHPLERAGVATRF